MTEVEITQDEVKGIDVTQVASMQLKDGTVVVVQGEGEEAGYAEGEFTQEETAQEQAYDEYAEDYQDQSNQLRMRPMMGRVVAPVGVRPVVAPVPVRPVMPMRPPVRGPMPGPKLVRPPMVAGMPFRTRPGMRPGMVVAPPKPGVVVKPGMVVKPVPVPVGVKPMVKPVPVMRPPVMQPKPVPGRPMAPVVFRARPGETEEEGEFQEEYYEEDYGEYDDQQGAETQLRGRPFVPMGVAPRPLVKPAVVAPRPVVPVMAPKRGPLGPHHHPVRPGTFQPVVFRGRPRPPMVRPVPMAAPLKPGFPPRVAVRPVVAPRPMGFGPVFRSRPRSASYDAEQAYEEAECQYGEASVCTKCGKEF